ncbi:MAG: hypothetical protein JJU20_02605 [Opitutales bacterium]|nr:hypothetical protein [Opitutales bacterium]
MPKATQIHTGNSVYDSFYPRIRAFLEKDTMDMNIDGQQIRGYRSPDTPAVWLRDHSDMMRGFRFFEQDLTSAVTHFADTQARNGRIFDYFTVQPEKVPCERENWCKYVRVPVEADVEYRMVQAAYLAWQTTGDDNWVRSVLPAVEAGLEYIFSHPWRWDPESRLVKRPYTIDSWDFAYTAGMHDWLQFQIDENTFWGIMHGDNSGYYKACRDLATIYRALGEGGRAQHWELFAEGLKERMNNVCWNGQFYTHFVKHTPVTIEGVDEDSQLSFSNAMNINRGVTSHSQAVSILREYLKRGKQNKAFAEWFSIDPAFPDGIFGEEKIVAGAYCNGGIMPLVGGELARAYFEHGFEAEGVRTLQKYHELIARNNETYLWYFPDGKESSIDTSSSPDAMPTDGWGSSAMLYGFMEGLVGVQDRSKLMQDLTLCPRWHAADVTEAEVQVGYEVSGTQFGYQYREQAEGLKLTIEGARHNVNAHILLPNGARVANVQVGGKDWTFQQSKVEESAYLDFEFSVDTGTAIEVRFK